MDCDAITLNSQLSTNNQPFFDCRPASVKIVSN